MVMQEAFAGRAWAVVWCSFCLTDTCSSRVSAWPECPSPQIRSVVASHPWRLAGGCTWLFTRWEVMKWCKLAHRYKSCAQSHPFSETLPDEGQNSYRSNNTKGVVYKIACECGRVYVGETRRTLKQRIIEHKQAVRNADSNNGLAVHVAGTGHPLGWSRGCVQRRTVDKKEDQRELDHQSGGFSGS